MGPRLFSLASLALLLLALCRTLSSADVIVQSWSQVKTVSTESDVKKGVTGEVVKAENKKSLDDLMGNTIMAAMAKSDKAKFDALPDYLKKAINHGVQCDKLNIDETNKKAIKLMYDVETAEIPADPVFKAVKDVAAAIPNADLKIDCTDNAAASNVANKCLCEQKKALLVCLIHKINTDTTAADPASCRAGALTALKSAGKGELGKLFEQSITTEAQLETEDEKVLCDATNGDVETAVKKVYAADALFWLRDEILITILELEEVDLDKVCALPEIKEYHPIAACMCSHELGFSFCYLKELSKYYQEEEYIDCKGAAPAKVEAKKPSKEKKDAKIKPKAKKGSEGGGSGGGSSTTAPSQATSAATSILPLAPAATAAALLLLRH